MKLKPFDLTLVEDMSMYDHLPYQRDADRCNAGAIALYSGNVLKYYRCSLGEVLEFADMDELAAVKIGEYIEREKERLSAFEEASEVIDSFDEDDYTEEGLSDEQLAGLLSDKPKKKALLGDYDDEDF